VKVNANSWKELKYGEFLPIECTPTVPSGDLQKAGNELIVKVAKKIGLPILFTLDSHFINPEDKTIQDMALQNGKDEDMGLRFSSSYSMMQVDEAWGKWRQLHEDSAWCESVFQEGVENNKNFASLCEAISFDKKYRLPDVDIPETITVVGQDNRLLEYTRLLIQKYERLPESEEYQERIEKELDVICNNGKINLLPYFITLHDICVVARNIGIAIGPGRGSAAGCLLSYLLNITQRDPIKNDLSFERFLSQGRINRGKLPDIDMDFSDPERLATALKDIYGDKIVRVCTTGTNKVKNAIRDVSRVLLNTKENPEEKREVEDVCKTVSNIPQGVSDLNKWLDGYEEDGNHVAGELDINPSLRSFFEHHPDVEKIVRGVLGIPRSIGRHAAAYCIADSPIHEIVPICKVKGEICTQFTMGPIEEIGLVKFDMLGLNTLKDISSCIELIKQRHKVEIDMYKIPEDDISTYIEFCRGKTPTVFQFNGSVPTSVCKKVMPKNIKDLSAITAACRPGTMHAECEDENGTPIKLIDLWIKRRRGESKTTFIHPSLEPILSETAGIFIFQEQLNRMFVECCGYSPEKADEIREIIGKKKKDKMDEILPDIKGRLKEKGWNKTQIDSVVSLCIAASSYVFNLSHSDCYAYLGYVCMWLKTHYPLEWWNSILQNSSHKDLEVNSRHFKKYLMHPDVNMSETDFYIINDEVKKIVYPLSMIKGVKNAAIEIIKHKPFSSFEEFLSKVTKRVVNKRVVLAMLWAGAFDRMPEAQGKKSWQKRNSLYKKFCELRGEAEPQDLPPLEVMKNESLSLCVGEPNVHELYKLRYPGSSVSSIEDVLKLGDENRATTIGIVKGVREIKTKKGEDMCFVDLANAEFNISITVFPKLYQSSKEFLNFGEILRISGKINIYNDRKSIVADSITSFKIETTYGQDHSN
jgi:DNA polymerase III subunit alpha